MSNFLQGEPLSFYDVKKTSLQYYQDEWAHVANAVYLGKGWAISVSHNFKPVKPNPGFVYLFGGEAGSVEFVKDGMALVKILNPPKHWTKYKIAKHVPPSGEICHHSYWWWKTKRVEYRGVYLQSDTKIDGRFKKGMSGSGVFNKEGALIGLVEKKYGTIWSLSQIRSFIEAAEKKGILPKGWLK